MHSGSAIKIQECQVSNVHVGEHRFCLSVPSRQEEDCLVYTSLNGCRQPALLCGVILVALIFVKIDILADALWQVSIAV